jgi:para-aminobenzoate synthetase/4-amino-4-deoxychorismate lyase
MIVDMMRNDIGRIAEIGSVHVPSLFDVERYPTVWQMTSTVAAKTHASVTAILKALFPCASVTGAPKARTMEIIAELESSPRRIYTGAIGFIAPNRRAQLNVAIRTVLIEKRSGEAEYGVGGGVVWASTATGEYEECLTKARVLTAARPEFRLFETILCTPSDGLFLLDQHLARLRDSAEYFGFDYSDDAAREALGKVQCRSQPMRVKLLVSLKGTVSVELSPFNVQSAITHVRLSAFPVDSQTIFLYHKTTHRKVYEDAIAEMPECDDVILWNERGEITESTIANVVVEIDGEFFTPPVACGLLAGVFREKLLKEGTIKERIVTVAEFKQSPRIFLINSLRQWREARLLS